MTAQPISVVKLFRAMMFWTEYVGNSKDIILVYGVDSHLNAVWHLVHISLTTSEATAKKGYREERCDKANRLFKVELFNSLNCKHRTLNFMI